MTKIKICGLSRKEDIDAVNIALPDYAGFVFAPSKRRIGATLAEELKNRLDRRIEAVGVFVNEEPEAIAEIYKSGIIDMAQLHGDECDEYVKRLKGLCGCRVIKAVGVGGQLPQLPEMQDYLLFDTLSERRGGTGRAFDRGLLEGYRGPPYFIAGGLGLGNVAEVIAALSPYCVDVSSGVEENGAKDAAKILEFVRRARQNGPKRDTCP